MRVAKVSNLLKPNTFVVKQQHQVGRALVGILIAQIIFLDKKNTKSFTIVNNITSEQITCLSYCQR